MKITAVAREQPHPVAFALNDQAIAVVLDLVDPFRPVGDFRFAPLVGMQERGFGHGGCTAAN